MVVSVIVSGPKSRISGRVGGMRILEAGIKHIVFSYVFS